MLNSPGPMDPKMSCDLPDTELLILELTDSSQEFLVMITY